MSRTNADSEPKSKEEIPLLKQKKRKTTFAKRKGKMKFLQENEIKKSEDPERMQRPPEQSQFTEPSATSKEQTEGCPQTPHGPPPTPSSSPPIKRPKNKKSVSLVKMQEKISSNLKEEQEMEATSSKTYNMKVQESHGQHQLPELSEIGIKPSQCIFQTPQMPPRILSSSRQTPQMPPTAPSGTTHTPHLPLTSPREFQAYYLFLTSSSRVQAPHLSPTNPSGRIQTPHCFPASSREIQSPHLSPISCSKIQTPHISPTSSSSLQTPQMPPTPSNIIQNPQVCPATPSTSLQAPQKTATSFSSCLPMNPRLTTIPKEASKECGYQKGPKEVMVLKVTEPFTYDFKECGKKMFHATVATESEFFLVKVFDINSKDKFVPEKVIAISDYIGRNGFLEIYSASSVSDVSANRKMEISYRLVQNANATPKIEYLCSNSTIKYVNGVYRVYKKNVREDCTYYEIQDDTGKMEVVVYGRLTYINCEEGDELNLFCFELAFSADKWQLRSVFHSYIKVIKTRKCKTRPLNHDSNMDTSQESS